MQRQTDGEETSGILSCWDKVYRGREGRRQTYREGERQETERVADVGCQKGQQTDGQGKRVETEDTQQAQMWSPDKWKRKRQREMEIITERQEDKQMDPKEELWRLCCQACRPPAAIVATTGDPNRLTDIKGCSVLIIIFCLELFSSLYFCGRQIIASRS